MNDILLNKRKITRSIPEDEDRDEDEYYAHQEIRVILYEDFL
jgi:hypothetical protein